MNYQPVYAENQTNYSVEDAAFDGKEQDFDVKKPESKVILSPSSSAQSKEQDDKTKKEAKGKSPIESVTGYRDLNAEFDDCSENSSNEVNAASSTVSTVGQNSLNNTNTFSDAGPSNTADIIYSVNEDVVGTEADFNNLESSIPVSPIPTTIIYKDHPVSQIIVDLSSTTQTRSMTRAVKDQGFEDPDHPKKVYKVVKALYGLHQAPRAWYETLATYLLENGFQRGTIDQTLFIKNQNGDILLVQIYVKQKKDGIFISQDKYVAEILRKFGLIKGKSASTPIDTEKPLLKDPDGEDVDCKKQTVIAISSTEAEYIAAASCCAQVLWIQNQLLDYGSAMAFAIICLSTGRKFNFSKYIFETLVRNVDSSSKFYMYPRFIQLIIQNQLGDLSTHTTTYTSPALTQKVFANMKRVRKGFSGVETPLFEGMLVGVIEEQGAVDEQVQDDAANTIAQGANTVVQGDDVYDPSIPSPTPPTPPPQQSQDLPSTSQEVLDACDVLTRRVEHLEYDKVAQALEITKRIDSSDDIVMEDASNQGRRIDDLDKDDAIDKEAEKKAEEAKVAGDDQVKGMQAEIYHIDMDHASKVLNGQAQVWKNQRTVYGQAKVKSWKLLESCAIHIITFTTTQLILLVERRYPLSRFTLDQILNAVRFDYLEEFSGELMPTSIGNEERIKRDHKEYINLMEKLLAINSYPNPLENFHANTVIETLPTSPIPVKDGDSLREEIDIFTGTDDLMPSGIENDDYDSEEDIYFLEELPGNDSISLPKNKSSNFDHHDDPLFPRSPPEPPDVEFFFDFEPNLGELISAVMNNIEEFNEDECFDPEGGEIDVFENIEDDNYFPFISVIRIFLPYLTYPKVSPLLISTRSEDTIFDLGISI
nr:hypothetical protein [Tanacetum cinerariifolium]